VARTSAGRASSLQGLNPQAEEAAENLIFGVILSEAKNLSSIQAQFTGRFFAALRMTPNFDNSNHRNFPQPRKLAPLRPTKLLAIDCF
jgi:hypothetical protein